MKNDNELLDLNKEKRRQKFEKERRHGRNKWEKGDRNNKRKK